MELAFGAIGLGLPMLQEHGLHKEEMRMAEDYHKQAIKLDIELARRDILQEMRGQKTDKLETLMVMDALMLGCCFGLLVEGLPPLNTPLVVLAFYSVTMAFAIGLFFTSVWIVMKAQVRIQRYNILNPEHPYPCGKTHKTFQHFYWCHCQNLARYAGMCYYGGVVAMVVTGVLLFHARFKFRYDADDASLIFTVSCVLFLATLVLLESCVASDVVMVVDADPGHVSTVSDLELMPSTSSLAQVGQDRDSDFKSA